MLSGYRPAARRCSTSTLDYHPTIAEKCTPLADPIRRYLAGRDAGRQVAKQHLADAEARLRRYHEAIASGVDPAALVEVINQAHVERAAARSEVENHPASTSLTDAEINAMIDWLGDVGATLTDARPAGLARLYQALNLELRYEPKEPAIYATAGPRVDSACVRREIELLPVGRIPELGIRLHVCHIATSCCPVEDQVRALVGDAWYRNGRVGTACMDKGELWCMTWNFRAK